MQQKVKKRKIINDPVYGFISIPDNLVFDLIEHPWFQRLSRIKQLGLTYFVYPSALHSRFQHALGCMHLMSQALDVLQSKGNEVTEEEREGAQVAILLHDIGHGPFSHTLEKSLVENLSHEELGLCIMRELNRQFDDRLSLALEIFNDTYPKKFLHQLVSSQLDMDRMDYLSRDSFFTGVAEGVISTHRILSMLNVSGDELVVEHKGIYSVENFIISRRLMYWQVYLHKTVMAAEYLLINVLRRAKYLAGQGVMVFSTPALQSFLANPVSGSHFTAGSQWIPLFMRLDDFDLFASIKVWMDHEDQILSTLSSNLINRRLYKVILQNTPADQGFIESIKTRILEHYQISPEELSYFIVQDTVANNAYSLNDDKIRILFRDGSLMDVSEASDQLNISVLSNAVRKHVLCFPKLITNYKSGT